MRMSCNDNNKKDKNIETMTTNDDGNNKENNTGGIAG